MRKGGQRQRNAQREKGEGGRERGGRTYATFLCDCRGEALDVRIGIEQVCGLHTRKGTHVISAEGVVEVLNQWDGLRVVAPVGVSEIEQLSSTHRAVPRH